LTYFVLKLSNTEKLGNYFYIKFSNETNRALKKEKEKEKENKSITFSLCPLIIYRLLQKLYLPQSAY